MKKWQLVARVASDACVSKATAERAVDGVFGAIVEALGRDEAVSISRFGSFSVRERSARMGRNPRTGEELVIEAAKVPAFRPSRALRAAVDS